MKFIVLALATTLLTSHAQEDLSKPVITTETKKDADGKDVIYMYIDGIKVHETDPLKQPFPPVVTPGPVGVLGAPPSDAIVLFDGSKKGVSQMVLNKGKCDGKQIVSEASVAEMTRRQTPESIKESYGLGWSVGPQFGHGGALATDMSIDPKRGLITVFLVQHAGFPGDGGKSKDAFKKAAGEKFGAVK